MTQNEIIEMARQVGFGNYTYEALSMFEAFAKLVEDKVRQELREEIIYTWVPPHFVDLAIKEEREACAQVCDDMNGSDWLPRQCAAAIRARGEA